MLGWARAPEPLLWAGLVLASAGTLDQYLGLGGVFGYAVGAAVGVPFALRVVRPILLRHLGERGSLVLAAATLVALVVVFAVVYPHVNAHSGVRGSDRDDAANLAARHLMHGEYPYSQPTYLGNLISQLPGAVLLATPFVAVGNSAYQNFFWLVALFVVLRALLRDGREALGCLWLVLLGAPGVLRELLTGGDLISNAAYLIVFGLGVTELRPTTRARRLARFGAAVGLGLALSSRANVLALAPLLFAVVARRDGLRAAVALLGTSLLTCAAVTLPFYAYSPGRFTPLLTADKISRLETVLPHATGILIGLTGLLTVVIAFWLRGTGAAALRAFALVEGALLVASVALASAAAHAADFGFLLLGYGLLALFPAAVGVWLERLRPVARP